MSAANPAEPSPESVAHLAAVVESSNDAVISKTLEGVILSWNVGAEHVYGYAAAEAVGRHMTLLLPSDRSHEETEILQRIGRGERVEHFETVRRTRRGDLIDVSLTISPIRNRNGVIIGASHVARDITERKRLDQRLQHLAAMVESSEDAIISKSLDGAILSWNSGAERVYGYSAAETIGRPMTLLLPPDRPNEEIEILERIARGERVEHFETVRRTRSGEAIDVSLTISPIREPSGRIVGASHVARDITDRKQLSERLQHLAALVESSEDAIISKTLQGTILTWNLGAERLYGYPASEMIGLSMTLLLPEDRSGEETEILERIARGERVEHFETTRRTKSGAVIDVSLTVSPIRDESSRITGASHVARNITDRKRLDEQLLQGQKLESLGVLAGGVAHDFNNLLTGILGNTSLALEILSTDSPVIGILRDVVSASERASHLTRQLLAYAGKGSFVIEPVNLSGLVREIAALIQTSISKNVHLRLDLRDDIPPVQADSSQLQQVVMNLVINASEAISPDQRGAVLVTTGVRQLAANSVEHTIEGSVELAPGSYVSLDVHDNGCGMDEATLSRIFDPFFTTKFTGRGLGLAAVQGIVRSHKGALRVTSQPGHGTTFSVLLPATEETAKSNQGPALELRGNGELILVVDDEEVIRRTAKGMLERYGYTVVVAQNGKDGVDLFQVLRDKISVVLLDLTMPVMNGDEAFRRLKQIKPEVVVVLSSGYSELEAIRRFNGTGIAGFLQKPYSTSAIAQKIRSVLKKPAGSDPTQALPVS